MKFYKCISYNDGSTIPAHIDLSISNCSINAVNGTYNNINPKKTGIQQVWQNDTYICGLDTTESCWVINTIKNGVTKNNCLYYFGIDAVPTTTGNGQTVASAYLWQDKANSEEPWKTV